MARQYTVRSAFPLGTPSTADEQVLNTQIDLALLLSQRLQKQVRQGRSFRLHSVQASLQPAGGNHDIGVAFSGTLAWCPATKNSVKAWQHAFNVWRKQKALRVGASGSIVKYDDFEVAFGSQNITSRTSTVFAEGLNDNDTESVVIYGPSNDGVGTNRVSLEDIYESANTPSNLAPSRFPLDNTQVKASKYTETFPASQGAPIVAHLSANSAQTGYDSGATVSAPLTYIKDGATLCGVLNIYGTMLPENTGAHVQDAMTLVLTMNVSMGSPLTARKPRRMTKAKRGRPAKFKRTRRKAKR